VVVGEGGLHPRSLGCDPVHVIVCKVNLRYVAGTIMPDLRGADSASLGAQFGVLSASPVPPKVVFVSCATASGGADGTRIRRAEGGAGLIGLPPGPSGSESMWAPSGSHCVRALVVTVALLAAACCGPAGEGSAPPEEPRTTTTAMPTVEDYPDAITRRLHRMATEPRPVEPSAMPPRHLDAETFPVSLVPRDRIVWGGVAPDAIPAIDDPVVERASSVDWLDDREAVLVLQLDGEPRAYPIQVLMWHEIVNDEVDGRPVAVTYCPLCNSGVAFDRTVEGRTLDFGTSGSLYLSALVMYDRQTESLWTHFDGRAVVGTLAGAELEMLPVSTVA